MNPSHGQMHPKFRTFIYRYPCHRSRKLIRTGRFEYLPGFREKPCSRVFCIIRAIWAINIGRCSGKPVAKCMYPALPALAREYLHGDSIYRAPRRTLSRSFSPVAANIEIYLPQSRPILLSNSIELYPSARDARRSHVNAPTRAGAAANATEVRRGDTCILSWICKTIRLVFDRARGPGFAACLASLQHQYFAGAFFVTHVPGYKCVLGG